MNLKNKRKPVPKVYGQTIDGQTRCVHYHTGRDIIAIKFQCCQKYYPCYQCHEAEADHPIIAWPARDFAEKAILCGVCNHELSIESYLKGLGSCPDCQAAFNPNCQLHEKIYFSIN